MKIFLNVYSIFLGCRTLIQVEKILKGSLDSILSPSPSMKTQIMGRKICWRCKGETLLGVVNKLLGKHPAMFCLYVSSKLSRPYFEFSLHLKVMGLNQVYLFKSFLLYHTTTLTCQIIVEDHLIVQVAEFSEINKPVVRIFLIYVGSDLCR